MLAESGVLGHELTIEEEIHRGQGSEQHLEVELTQKARRLVAVVTNAGLPKKMGNILQEDFRRIGMVLAKLVPSAKMVLRLDLMGENGCKRWHQDQYTGRAVVSYNCCATEFVDHKHVNFWEMKNCGNNDHIIRDISQICTADVGDILFMKGTTFPSVQSGLVHRSPDPRLDVNGKVMNRLLLKVDLLRPTSALAKSRYPK